MVAHVSKPIYRLFTSSTCSVTVAERHYNGVVCVVYACVSLNNNNRYIGYLQIYREIIKLKLISERIIKYHSKTDYAVMYNNVMCDACIVIPLPDDDHIHIGHMYVNSKFERCDVRGKVRNTVIFTSLLLHYQ